MESFLFRAAACVAFVAIAAAQTLPRVERNIAYAEPKNERQLLDVYQPATGSNHPVVVWVHGGGWMRGSKEEIHHKPAAFVEKGYLHRQPLHRVRTRAAKEH
jgi:acetyl esterase/lipase